MGRVIRNIGNVGWVRHSRNPTDPMKDITLYWEETNFRM
jgi:hypothetical protein